MTLRILCFNPHSPLLANELHLVLGTDGHRVGFNPHSPLLANEFLLFEPLPFACPCFNPHSPLLANELHTGRIDRIESELFQSTFAIAGE